MAVRVRKDKDLRTKGHEEQFRWSRCCKDSLQLRYEVIVHLLSRIFLQRREKRARKRCLVSAMGLHAFKVPLEVQHDSKNRI